MRRPGARALAMTSSRDGVPGFTPGGTGGADLLHARGFYCKTSLSRPTVCQAGLGFIGS